MLLFFKKSGWSPLENVGPDMQELQVRIIKRIGAAIAIIRNIVKHKLSLPTVF